ncbi:hypothetical protein HK102_006631 [Quaeritorhiza haematococci]|nr:hypothetical protein HK102_006631 [Quaeritorhiza haematococci]
MKATATLLTASAVLLSSATLASGHALMVDPPPRNVPDMRQEPGGKLTPFPPPANLLNSCNTQAGPTTPGDAVATFTAGQTVTVRWKISIPHRSDPGVRIAVRYGETENFEVLADNIDVNTLSADVQLPAGKTSQNAVIQWIWASQEDGGFYLGCSDVAITAAGGGAGGAPGAGAGGATGGGAGGATGGGAGGATGGGAGGAQQQPSQPAGDAPSSSTTTTTTTTTAATPDSSSTTTTTTTGAAAAPTGGANDVPGGSSSATVTATATASPIVSPTDGGLRIETVTETVTVTPSNCLAPTYAAGVLTPNGGAAAGAGGAGAGGAGGAGAPAALAAPARGAAPPAGPKALAAPASADPAPAAGGPAPQPAADANNGGLSDSIRTKLRDLMQQMLSLLS